MGEKRKETARDRDVNKAVTGVKDPFARGIEKKKANYPSTKESEGGGAFARRVFRCSFMRENGGDSGSLQKKKGLLPLATGHTAFRAEKEVPLHPG